MKNINKFDSCVKSAITLLMGNKRYDKYLTSSAILLKKKIDALRAIGNDFPTVIIVQNLDTMAVEYMSPAGLRGLGLTEDELAEIGEDYLSSFFNSEHLSEYFPKILDLIHSGDDDKVVSFFQQVKIAGVEGWSWFLGTSKVFMRDAKARVTHLITTAAPVDPLYHVTPKVNRLLEEAGFLEKHQQIFDTLTKREVEVFKLMALGTSSFEIAEQLFISEQTVQTHRKNIRCKLKVQTNYEITRFAQAFNVI